MIRSVNSSSSKRVLLVEDDLVLGQTLSENLESHGFLMTNALNGKDALSRLHEAPFDIVLSDIMMPELNGIELSQKVAAEYKIPTILITGISHLLSPEELSRHRAELVIAKPLRIDQLVSCLHQYTSRTLTPPRPKYISSKDGSYCKFSIDELLAGNQIKYAVYMQINAEKFVKIASVASDLTPDRIRHYKRKGIRFLFLSRDDYRKYVGNPLRNLGFNPSLSPTSREKTNALLDQAYGVLLDQIAYPGLDLTLLGGAIAFLEATLDMLCDIPEVYSLMDKLSKHTNYLFSHTLGTSLFSVLLAQSEGWRLPANKFKVAAGALLHDVGLLDVSSDLLMRLRSTWRPDELKKYEAHTARGHEMLSALPNLPTDILNIALKHHDDLTAKGLSPELRRGTLHPMSRLVSVANEFCNLTLPNPHHDKLAPLDAIQQMKTFEEDRLDPLFFNALKRLFNVDLPKTALKRAQMKPKKPGKPQ